MVAAPLLSRSTSDGVLDDDGDSVEVDLALAQGATTALGGVAVVVVDDVRRELLRWVRVLRAPLVLSLGVVVVVGVAAVCRSCSATASDTSNSNDSRARARSSSAAVSSDCC